MNEHLVVIFILFTLVEITNLRWLPLRIQFVSHVSIPLDMLFP